VAREVRDRELAIVRAIEHPDLSGQPETAEAGTLETRRL